MKKAKAIKHLIFEKMSPLKYDFSKWTREMFYKRAKMIGARMKA